MALLSWLAVVVVIVGVIFVMYPEPPLTPKLIEWKNGGQFFNFKGHNIFYRVETGKNKTGGTLLCLHGFPTSSYDWKKVLESLKEKFSRVVLYDYIGFGLSDKPKDHNYTTMEQTDIGEAILKYLGITEVHLLTHDYGDTVALEYLARYNRGENKDGVPVIKSLCLTNGGFFIELVSLRMGQKLLLNPYLGPIASRLTNFFFFKSSRGLKEVFGPDTYPDESEFWDFFVLVLHKGGNTNQHRVIQYMRERTKFKDRWIGALKDTQIKVHLIYGPSDPVNPDTLIDFYKKTAPQHGVTVLSSKIGHYPQWEAPEELTEAYYTFIDSARS